MKKKIAVFAGDKYLRRKIYLILSPYHEVVCADIEDGKYKNINSDLVIWNLNDGRMPSELSSHAVTLGEGGILPIPFSEEMLLDAVSEKEEEKPEGKLILGEKCAYIYGKTIHLTDAEYSLLSLLVRARGEYLSREELIFGVWGDSTTDGILNVYIHYLREKIEFRGEKVIISSRKFGYKIDEKFVMRGEGKCLE